MRSKARIPITEQELPPTMPNSIFPARVDYETHRKQGPFIDGDTFIVEFLLKQEAPGRRMQEGDIYIRLLGLDTPEVRTTDPVEKERGMFIAVKTREWLESAGASGEKWYLKVQTFKWDSFGRSLAVVWNTATGEALNDWLFTFVDESGEPLVKVRSVLEQLKEA